MKIPFQDVRPSMILALPHPRHLILLAWLLALAWGMPGDGSSLCLASPVAPADTVAPAKVTEPTDSPTSQALQLLAGDGLTTIVLLAYLTDLATRHPSEAGVWEALGEAQERAGDESRAIEAYRKATGLEAARAHAWLRLGILLKRDRRDPPGAIAALGEAIARGAPRAQALNELGVAHAYNQEMPKAMDCWNRAIDEDSAWGVLYANALKGSLSLGDEGAARSYYERGKQTAHPEENLFIQWGEYLLSKKQRRHAIEVYAEGARRLPSSARVAYYHAQALREAGHEKEARPLFERAAQLDPEGALGEVSLWSRRALFLMDFPKDEKEFQSCVREFFEALRREYPARSRQMKTLHERLDRLVVKHPDFWNAWQVKAWTLRRLGRYEEARASLDRALALHPEEPNAWHEYGLLLREMGNPQQARERILKAHRLAPSDPSVLMNLSLVEADLGLFDQAESRLARVEEMAGAKATDPIRLYIQEKRTGKRPEGAAYPQVPVGSLKARP